MREEIRFLYGSVQLTLDHDKSIDIPVGWLLQAAVSKYLYKFVIFYLIEAGAGPAGGCPLSAELRSLHAQSLLRHEVLQKARSHSGQMTGGWRLRPGLGSATCSLRVMQSWDSDGGPSLLLVC